MKIKRLTNQDKNFYNTLGPFLARRDIEREIGYKVYDDDGKEWLIATEMNKIIGFCYIQEKPKSHYRIGSCYVVDKYRQKGVFKELFKNAIKNIKGVATMTTKNKHLMGMLIKHGFTESKQRGSFTEYSKEFGVDEEVRESGL